MGKIDNMKNKFKVKRSCLAPYKWHLQKLVKKNKQIELWETISKCNEKHLAYFFKNALEKQEPEFMACRDTNDP